MTVHSLLWIDHNSARLFHVLPEATHHPEEKHVKHHAHAHNKPESSGRREVDGHYLGEVAKLLHGLEKVLVAGPSNAKTELVEYLQKHDAQTAKRVVGVETVDHPTDGQLLAWARAWFEHFERMH